MSRDSSINGIRPELLDTVGATIHDVTSVPPYPTSSQPPSLPKDSDIPATIWDHVARHDAWYLTHQILQSTAAELPELARLSLHVCLPARWRANLIRRRMILLSLESSQLASTIPITVRVTGTPQAPHVAIGTDDGDWVSAKDFFSSLPQRLLPSMTASSQASSPFPVMSLPKELRQQVWYHALTLPRYTQPRRFQCRCCSYRGVGLASVTDGNSGGVHTVNTIIPSVIPLLQTSHQVHAEASYMLLSQHMLSISHKQGVPFVSSATDRVDGQFRRLRLRGEAIRTVADVSGPQGADDLLAVWQLEFEDRMTDFFGLDLREVQKLSRLRDLEIVLYNPVCKTGRVCHRSGMAIGLWMIKAVRAELPHVENVSVMADWLTGAELDEVNGTSADLLRRTSYKDLLPVTHARCKCRYIDVSLCDVPHLSATCERESCLICSEPVCLSWATRSLPRKWPTEVAAKEALTLPYSQKTLRQRLHTDWETERTARDIDRLGFQVNPDPKLPDQARGGIRA
ncbi:MAG: hypothetical protein M1825_005230 [Sarcosagium campestre]|nr:MAG: hypothetical protein M1825_005230 [Sarcosagium campestre]